MYIIYMYINQYKVFNHIMNSSHLQDSYNFNNILQVITDYMALVAGLLEVKFIA